MYACGKHAARTPKIGSTIVVLYLPKEDGVDLPTLRALEIVGYYLLAYVIATIGGYFVVAIPYRIIASRFVAEKVSKRELRLSGMVGVVEQILYISAILINQPAFIGVWLLLKAAGEWGRHDKPGVADEYKVALIGNGLSVLVGVFSGVLIQAFLPPIPRFAPLHVPLSHLSG